MNRRENQMVVDLSKYDGDSFEAALDVFYGVMDDLKTQAADGQLTLTALETYRSQIVRETYSKLAGMKQSGSGLQDSPKQSRRLQRLQGRGLRRRDTGRPSSSGNRPASLVIRRLWKRWLRH